MKKLWMELTRNERVSMIAIIINVVVATIAAWIITTVCVPEFNGIFIPIREWKNVMRSSGYWEAYGLNTVITLIMIVVSWFSLTEKWRENCKNIVKEYISDLASYFKR